MRSGYRNSAVFSGVSHRILEEVTQDLDNPAGINVHRREFIG